jgi:hypothetical protein
LVLSRARAPSEAGLCGPIEAKRSHSCAEPELLAPSERGERARGSEPR